MAFFPETVGDDEVLLVYSPAAQKVVSCKLVLADISCATGSPTVQDMIAASGFADKFSALDINTAAVGIWGRKVSLQCAVRATDRVEIYRPLQVDPKEARRLRYRKQGPIQSRHRPGYKGP